MMVIFKVNEKEVRRAQPSQVALTGDNLTMIFPQRLVIIERTSEGWMYDNHNHDTIEIQT